MAPTSCVLGIDLGTSAVKVVALSLKGRILASAREPYGTTTICEGQAEQDCGHWLEALARAAKSIHQERSGNLRVEAVALTAQMPTLVALRDGNPTGLAITWQDSRADSWTTARLTPDLRRDIYQRTGVVIDGRYLAPMFGFHHSRRTKTDLILSAKDFLFKTLTGVAATDPSTASGYGVFNLRSGSWDEELCNLWAIRGAQLPDVSSSSFSAPLSKSGGKMLGCQSGIPVILGCADSAAGVYALNGQSQSTDTATILMGSSTVIMKCDSEPHLDPKGRYLVTPLAMDKTYGCEADLLASGSAREWVERIFAAGANNKARRLFWRAAHDVCPGANGLLFAPYLAGGEQGILWNPELKGMLHGLTLAHTPAQIARALLEGMSFEIRRCLELFAEDKPITSVRATGWTAESPEESQMLADILGRAVHIIKLESASAVGAALLSDAIDQREYFANKKWIVFKASGHAHVYNELYAKYVAQWAGTTPNWASAHKTSSVR